ncbi:hypothetical protein [Halalkaliarchaeum desulfuricum]|uniref:hypothetical protein n=1 Tax=Halalkaliarchaeum desulfuricum TaxID=2055893 RepID=UPI00105AB081|nr:hypothetical protein [Halalkaliarchaeum desulfuricum]
MTDRPVAHRAKRRYDLPAVKTRVDHFARSLPRRIGRNFDIVGFGTDYLEKFLPILDGLTTTVWRGSTSANRASANGSDGPEAATPDLMSRAVTRSSL